jgi:hypothetical protein
MDRVCEFPAIVSRWRLIAAGTFVSYLAVVGYAQAAGLVHETSPRYEVRRPSDESLPPHLRDKREDALKNLREEFNLPPNRLDDLKTPRRRRLSTGGTTRGKGAADYY